MDYRWDWSVLVTQPYLDWLLEGLGVTVSLSLIAWAIALPFGTLLGAMRSAQSLPPRLLALAYVQLFRNIPIVVQLFLWFFVLPEVLPRGAGHFLKRELPYPEFVTAAITLGLFTAARVAETVRAGIAALGPGKRAAALASGMTVLQTYRHILLPMALRLATPPLVSEFLTVFRNSSVALTIGVFDLTMQAHQVESFTYHGFEAFTAATMLYVAISWLSLALLRRYTLRAHIGGMIGQGSAA